MFISKEIFLLYLIIYSPLTAGNMTTVYAAMLNSLERIPATNIVWNDIAARDVEFNKILEYTFPGKFKCIVMKVDLSDYAQQFRNVVQAYKLGPAYINIELRMTLQCSGYLIFTQSLEALEHILSRILPLPSSLRMLCLVKEANQKEFVSFLKTKIYLFGDAQVMIFRWTDIINGFKLSHPVRTFKKKSMKTVTRKWRLQANEINNFKGQVIKYTTTNCSVWSSVEDIQSDHQPRTMRGLEGSIFTEISKSLNLKPVFIPPPMDNKTTYVGSYCNGTWKGGILELVDSGVADIGFCGLWIEMDKIESGLEVSTPIRYICLTYLVPRSKRKDTGWSAIFRPFTKMLWFILGMTIFSVSLTMFLMATFMKRFLRYQNHYFQSYGNCYFLVWGVLVNGWWPRSTKKLGPIRHILTGWVVFTLLITCGYSSTLFSNLTKPSFYPKPRSVADFLYRKYIWPEDYVFPVHRMLDINIPMHAEWNKSLQFVSTAEKARLLLKSDNTVIIGNIMENQFITYNADLSEEIIARYEVMDNCIGNALEGFVFRYGSYHKAAFNRLIYSLQETGIILKFIRDSVNTEIAKKPYLLGVSHTSSSSNHAATKLTIQNLAGCFEVLIGGLLLSSLVFICELLSKKVEHKDGYSKDA